MSSVTRVTMPNAPKETTTPSKSRLPRRIVIRSPVAETMSSVALRSRDFPTGRPNRAFRSPWRRRPRHAAMRPYCAAPSLRGAVAGQHAVVGRSSDCYGLPLRVDQETRIDAGKVDQIAWRIGDAVEGVARADGADVRRSGDYAADFVHRNRAMNMAGRECVVVRPVVLARHLPGFPPLECFSQF